MPKIIDCFIFYNEIDMLKFRLEYLYDIVDKFILVECTLTHSGDKKELYYEQNKHLFEKYNDKIVHIIVNDLPTKEEAEDAWVREKMHRNCINRGISQLSLNQDDIIVVCDVDEIPDRHTLRLAKNHNFENAVYSLEQDMYYYNLNSRMKNKWYHCRLVTYFTYLYVFNSIVDNIRIFNMAYIIQNGGWHFSFFGDAKFIQNKIKHYAHQEWNKDKYLDETNIIDQIKKCKDIFLRENEEFEYCNIKDNMYLPETYKDLLKFSNLY